MINQRPGSLELHFGVVEVSAKPCSCGFITDLIWQTLFCSCDTSHIYVKCIYIYNYLDCIVRNGVLPPINGRKKVGNWGNCSPLNKWTYNWWLWAHVVDNLHPWKLTDGTHTIEVWSRWFSGFQFWWLFYRWTILSFQGYKQLSIKNWMGPYQQTP